MANSTRRYHSAKKSDRFQRNPVIGVLAGWQFYNISTNLNYLLPIYQGINQAAEELDCSVLFGCGMGGGFRLGKSESSCLAAVCA